MLFSVTADCLFIYLNQPIFWCFCTTLLANAKDSPEMDCFHGYKSLFKYPFEVQIVHREVVEHRAQQASMYYTMGSKDFMKFLLKFHMNHLNLIDFLAWVNCQQVTAQPEPRIQILGIFKIPDRSKGRAYRSVNLRMTFWCLQFSKNQHKNLMEFCHRI